MIDLGFEDPKHPDGAGSARLRNALRLALAAGLVPVFLLLFTKVDFNVRSAGDRLLIAAIPLLGCWLCVLWARASKYIFEDLRLMYWRLHPRLKHEVLTWEEVWRRTSLAVEDLAIAQAAGLEILDLKGDPGDLSFHPRIEDTDLRLNATCTVYATSSMTLLEIPLGCPLQRLIDARVLAGLPGAALHDARFEMWRNRHEDLPRMPDGSWSAHRRLEASHHLAAAGFPAIKPGSKVPFKILQ